MESSTLNKLYDGMKTKMGLLLFLHYTNASSIQRASLWLKACLLQWAIRSFHFNDCYTTYKIRCRGRACDKMTCEPDGSNHWLFHHGAPSVWLELKDDLWSCWELRTPPGGPQPLNEFWLKIHSDLFENGVDCCLTGTVRDRHGGAVAPQQISAFQSCKPQIRL